MRWSSSTSRVAWSTLVAVSCRPVVHVTDVSAGTPSPVSTLVRVHWQWHGVSPNILDKQSLSSVIGVPLWFRTWPWSFHRLEQSLNLNWIFWSLVLHRIATFICTIIWTVDECNNPFTVAFSNDLWRWCDFTAHDVLTSFVYICFTVSVQTTRFLV